MPPESTGGTRGITQLLKILGLKTFLPLPALWRATSAGVSPFTQGLFLGMLTVKSQKEGLMKGLPLTAQGTEVRPEPNLGMTSHTVSAALYIPASLPVLAWV